MSLFKNFYRKFLNSAHLTQIGTNNEVDWPSTDCVCGHRIVRQDEVCGHSPSDKGKCADTHCQTRGSVRTLTVRQGEVYGHSQSDKGKCTDTHCQTRGSVRKLHCQTRGGVRTLTVRQREVCGNEPPRLEKRAPLLGHLRLLSHARNHFAPCRFSLHGRCHVWAAWLTEFNGVARCCLALTVPTQI